MLYLDNDVLAKYARPEPDQQVVEYLKKRHAEPWGIAAIVAYEFLSYYEKGEQNHKLTQLRTRVVDEITPFDAETALEAADIRSSLGQADTSLDTGDLLIAATARQHGGTLVTGNKNDFDKPPVRQLLDVDIVPSE